MTMWGSHGFDIYEINEAEYEHKTVFSPRAGRACFAEVIDKRSEHICIYLPLYNTVEKLFIGIKKDDNLIPIDDKACYLPIVIYGNSVTQGASASRSGNAFCNILQRITAKNTINLSVSAACKAQLTAAKQIGLMNLDSLILDYTRNAWTLNELETNWELFYNEIRYFHPQKPIIVMTTSCFNKEKLYLDFDRVIFKLYLKHKSHDPYLFILNVRQLFDITEYQLISIDGIHYNDYAMTRIASEIARIRNAIR